MVPVELYWIEAHGSPFSPASVICWRHVCILYWQLSNPFCTGPHWIPNFIKISGKQRPESCLPDLQLLVASSPSDHLHWAASRDSGQICALTAEKQPRETGMDYGFRNNVSKSAPISHPLSWELLLPDTCRWLHLLLDSQF